MFRSVDNGTWKSNAPDNLLKLYLDLFKMVMFVCMIALYNLT